MAGQHVADPLVAAQLAGGISTSGSTSRVIAMATTASAKVMSRSKPRSVRTRTFWP